MKAAARLAKKEMILRIAMNLQKHYLVSDDRASHP